MPNNQLVNIDLDFDIHFIVAAMPGYVYWKDVNSVYRGCNNNLAKVSKLKSPADIVGKKDEDFEWGKAAASAFVAEDIYVMTTGKTHVAEQNLLFENEIRQFRTEKRPLIGKSGKIIGVFGVAVDITAEKEAESLRSESERQKIAIREQEKFGNLARMVAHDINSPLTALRVMIDLCDELPEEKRILLRRATESILDIGNNLIANYHIDKHHQDIEAEPHQVLLVSDLLVQLLSEKKMQYRDSKIRFAVVIDDNAHIAFVSIQKNEFRRALSNLINNAVDALKEKKDGVVTVRLMATSYAVMVSIEDNGVGMSEQNVEKMQHRRYFTAGKDNGHGLGLRQVWNMLQVNRGRLAVQSTLGQGTLIKLTFSRAYAAKWLAKEMRLLPNQIIAILDDEQSMHDAWHMHFAELVKRYPQLQFHYFTQGKELLNFMNGLTSLEKDQVLLLIDYELLHQGQNGLEVIQNSYASQVILVTSHHANPKMHDVASQLKIKILPKQLASMIPIVVQ